MAELTKFTWIVLFPLWVLLWCLRWPEWKTGAQSVIAGRGLVKSEALQLGTILLLAVYLINLGYGFENSFDRLKNFTFISQTLGGADAHEKGGNRFRGTWLGELPVPVPENYLRGIDVQKYDFERGKWSYLRGENKFGGWWYYYLYAFAVKTPVGTLLLLGLAIVLTIVDPKYRRSWRDEVVLLAPAIAVFVLVSSQTGFNRYYRYVLPALPFIYIWISKVGLVFSGKSRLLKAFVIGCLGWSVVSSFSVFPHSMSYFNELAGGPKNGWKHLCDANIDWGQDLLNLKRWYDKHPEARPFHLAYFGFVDPHIAGIESRPLPEGPVPGVNDQADRLQLGPQPGWHAVSVNHLAGYKHYETDQPYYTYFQKFKPVAMAGYSIYIYHLELPEVNRVRREMGLPELPPQ